MLNQVTREKVEVVEMAQDVSEVTLRIPPPRRSGRRSVGRIVALVALAGFFAAGVALIALPLTRHSTHRATPPPRPVAHPKPKAKPKPRPKKIAPKPPAPIKLAAVGAYDPQGDGHENDSSAGLATDGDPTTAWHTEHYRTWFKPGVGLVIDAHRPVRAKTVTLRTDSPGFTAEILAGSSPRGPFVHVSGSRDTTATTGFALREQRPYRYLVLWITKIADGSAASVNELSAKG